MIDTLPLVKGSLDLLVLRALNWTPMHGFEVTTWLESQSEGRLAVEDSALYQALYRMEKRGLVDAEWGTTEHNRRARYYRLTRRGRRYLEAETARWLQYAELVSGILTTAPHRA